MRKIKFIEGGLYHVFNRGVDKRRVFLDDEDYFRFIHDLYEFNDEEPALNIYYKKPLFKNSAQSYESYEYESYEAKPRKIEVEKKKRKLIVEILAFCLMPNHFHLFLKQRAKDGISKFMHKLGTGYTASFNEKYERSGSLFQGPYKAVEIKRESHFIHLPFYIHANPLDLTNPGWREAKINNFNKAMNFLEKYRWSSLLDYCGNKNFPSVTQREFLSKFFGGTTRYKKDFLKWLKEMNYEDLKEISFE